MRIILDLDDTLSRTKNRDWQNSQPIADVCNKVREIQEKMPDAEIYIHTARGMNSCKGDALEAERRNRPNIENFLSKNGIKVDGIIFGKPLGDLYVDDKAMSADEFANSDVRTYEGLSGAKVRSVGRMVVKECADAAEQAEWYEKAASYGFKVPKIYCCQLGKLYMEYAGQGQWSVKPHDIMELIHIIRKFSEIQTSGINDLEQYAMYCHKRAQEAGENDKDLPERIIKCDALKKPTFCHGDFSLRNVLNYYGQLTIIDPSQKPFMSHWLVDAAKLRASVNWLDYGLTGYRLEWEGLVGVFDSMFSDEEMEIIKILEESHYYRVLRYAVSLGKVDVYERLKSEFRRRVK